MPTAQLSPEFIQYMTEEERRAKMGALPRDYIPPASSFPPSPSPVQEKPVEVRVRPGRGLGGSRTAPKRLSDEELMKMALAMQAAMGEEHEARMRSGPAVKPR